MMGKMRKAASRKEWMSSPAEWPTENEVTKSDSCTLKGW